MKAEDLQGAIAAIDKEMLCRSEELKRLVAAKEGLRMLCPHTNRKYDGHDHNYDYEVCLTCGETFQK